MSEETFVGIDVSQGYLDLATRPGRGVRRFINDKGGILDLATFLGEISPASVVMEATGGLEGPVAVALAVGGIPVAILNPRQVRDFARATGRLAKTDTIDAEVLAHFAQALRPEARPLPDERSKEMAAFLARREQVVNMIVAEKNRLKRALSAKVEENIKAHITFLEGQLKEIEEDLRRAVEESPLWRTKDDLFKGVPGIGQMTSMTLLFDLPELGTLGRKEIASLVGVAPINWDSGTHRGKRKVWGGRARVRCVLYMATLVAARYNPIIKAFYRRLIESGKAKKVALTACMRKLLTILNAMVKHNTPWAYQTIGPCS